MYIFISLIIDSGVTSLHMSTTMPTQLWEVSAKTSKSPFSKIWDTFDKIAPD